MADPGRTPLDRWSRRLLAAAATSYAANCALGASVATGVLDTRRHRWVHHALYSLTSALTVGAATVALPDRAARRSVGAPLLPALAVLAAIPRIRARTPTHVRLGLAAAPSYALGLWRAWR